jgi:hypothetical protein
MAGLLWESAAVNRQTSIRLLLAIFMIAGLVMAPLSRPVMAQASSDASMHAMMDDMSASAMADDEMANDMPCCPPKAPAPIGCDKCISMAACNAQGFTGLSAAVVQPLVGTAGTIISLRNESRPDGLGHPPPDQPPRTLI